MILESRQQVENTREKVRLLEERCRAYEADPGAMSYARRLTLRSLRRMIDQMKEEVERFESRVGATSGRES